MTAKANGIKHSRFLTRPFGVLAAVVLLLSTPAPVGAQQGNPEVYVDMSVLQGLGGQPAVQKPLVLRPPVTSPLPASRLIEPEVAPPPSSLNLSSSLAHRDTAAPVTTVSKPPTLPPVPVTAVPPPMAQPIVTQAKEPVAPTSVAFPVTTTIRQETSDPAALANTSRPVPVRSGIAGNLHDVVPSRPAPDFDPAASSVASQPVRDLTEKPQDAGKNVVRTSSSQASERPPVLPGRKPAHKADNHYIAEATSQKVIAVSAAADAEVAQAISGAEKAPPVPSRRPDIEKVSPEIIAALIERENKKMTAEKKVVDLAAPAPPPGPRGAKNMPAVAKPAVEAEPLQEQVVKLPDTSDPLLGNLVEKDKADLVATIESLVAAREDGKPLPKKERKVVREQGSNLIAAEPMQRPYNVYRPQQNSSSSVEEPPEVADESVAVSAHSPQSSTQTDPNHLSLSFDEGITTVEDAVANAIEARLLPLLNNNPGWKLQIQAFAGPDKDGTAGSARKASLARGMAVRSYLLGKGIEASRMEVRALGASGAPAPKDRVDLIVIDPTQKG